MNNVLETLFYPLDRGLNISQRDTRITILNARYHPALDRLKIHHLNLQQYFKPYTEELEHHGFPVGAEIKNEKSEDFVFILLPKNMTESRFLIASGINMLKNNGHLICAADNKAGGTRIAGLFREFGILNPQEASKNKARVVWGLRPEIIPEAVKAALDAGKMQQIQNGAFVSMPGIFGWDKIDQGSQYLTRHLPDNLAGTGADFGCGYGYLARHVLKVNPGIQTLYCIDADSRAIDACRENLENFKTTIHFLWADLTQRQAVHDLDWIVMNPPFHEGKQSKTDIGKDFIKQAVQSLKSGGTLFMVANAHLPYEDTLATQFLSYEKLHEGEGFKIYKAKK